MKKLEEMKNYDPFGRGGGGAPLRDKSGNIISNLKKYSAEGGAGGGDETMDLSSHREPPQSFNRPSDRQPIADTWALDFPANEKPSTAISSEVNYARGGHGIFGNPKTEEQKNQEEKYKRALQQQMEEKKRKQEEEKRKIREQEEKEERKLQESARREAEERNREKLKIKFKEDEMRMRNEELMREASGRKTSINFKNQKIDLTPRIVPESSMNDDWAMLKRELVIIY